MTSHADSMRSCRDAAVLLAEKTGRDQHDVALVLGSGWLEALESVPGCVGVGVAEFDNTELPGFLPPAVAGHAGRIRSMNVGRNRVLALIGRTHFYEDRDVAAVVHGVRVAAAAGCKVTVLTNGCGGLRPDMRVGEPVLISDHLNLTSTSPLNGAQFVDLTDLYAQRLRNLVFDIDPTITQGVYAQLPGPHYETPAEVRMLRTMGADLVGMSTALEAIAARAAGCEVVGISLVTNLAAGITGEPLNHAEVLAAGKTSAQRVGVLLEQLMTRL